MPFPLTTTDDLGRTLHLPRPPRRIVSLVPSLTELLSALDLDEEVVGVTRFCVHPEDWRARKAEVGGTKTVDVPAVLSLSPDLVIANKEENLPETVAALEPGAPVWVSDPSTVDQALALIRELGRVVDRGGRADVLATELRRGFEALRTRPPVRVAWLVWRGPWMAAGGDTFISDVLARGGFENVFGARRRYPEIGLEELAAARPDLVLLGSEPFRFTGVHVDEVAAALPGSAIRLADGEAFSWYGPRMGLAPEAMAALRADLPAAG